MGSRVSPNSLRNLRKGGGRPKGQPNHVKAEVAEFYRRFLESPDYQASARSRMIAGTAPHLESLAHHYAYGKPIERHELTGKDGTPLRAIEVILP